MRTIGNTANAKALAIGVASYCGEVSMEFGAHFMREQRRTTLCAEDNVNQELRERLRHEK